MDFETLYFLKALGFGIGLLVFSLVLGVLLKKFFDLSIWR